MVPKIELYDGTLTFHVIALRAQTPNNNLSSDRDKQVQWNGLSPLMDFHKFLQHAINDGSGLPNFNERPH